MITLRCSCGKGLRVRDHAAGKRIKCPACGTILTVPRPEPPEPSPEPAGFSLVQEEAVRPSDGFGLEPEPEPEAGPEAADVKNCPQCRVALPSSAVICNTCGYDYRTGRTFEAPKSLMQKLPWKKAGKVVWSVLGLAIVLGAVILGYNHIKKTQEKARTAASTADAPGKRRPARSDRDAAASPLLVSTGFTYPQPRLRKDFKFHYDDGVYSPAKTRLTLREAIAREAAGSLQAGGFKTHVHQKGTEPPKGSLSLRIHVDFGWIYQRVGGRLEPKQTYVKSCVAHLYLRTNIVVWKSPKAYAASPPPRAAKPAPAELEAVASLRSAKARVNFGDHAQKAAEAIVHDVLAGAPDGSALRKLVERSKQDEKRAQSVLKDLKPAAVSRSALKLIAGGNQYVIAALAESLDDIVDEAVLEAIVRAARDPALAHRAQAALAKLAAARAAAKAHGPSYDLTHPDKVLLELGKTKFRQAGASFAAELPVVEAAAKRFPHLALAFATTALNLELDDAVKKRLRTLCGALRAKRPALAKPRADVLRQLARDAEAHLLGRAALWTLLTSDATDVEAPATAYLAKVAAGRLPDAAEPGADGKLHLAASQLAILRELARRAPKQGTEAAVALLMRVTASQRAIVRRHVALPPVEGPKLTGLVATLKSNTYKDIHDALLLAVRYRTPLRPLMAHMADAVAASDDPKLRAVVLYALAHTAQCKDPYLWSLAALLAAPQPDARRAAAERLRKLGPAAALVLPEVKAALDKETDGATRARLSAAVKGIAGPNP